MKENIKSCVVRALEKLFSKLSRSSCAKFVGRVDLQPLDLPYSTRGTRLRSVFARRIVRVEECSLSLIAFRVKGLRMKLIVCAAPRIELLFERASAYSDELSGLSLHLSRPILAIGDCMVRFEWKGTAMVLEPGSVEECYYCEKTLC